MNLRLASVCCAAWALWAALLTGCASVPDTGPSTGPVVSTAPIKTDAIITSTLVTLLDNMSNEVVNLSNVSGTPINDVLALGSPIGYTLRTRYLDIGIPLAEALSRDSDPVFRDKLVTEARWDSNSEVRSAAMIALAQKHDLGDIAVFNEALIHLDPGVRFGALEALQAWGHPDRAIPYLRAASERDTEPLLRVFAAAGLARLGDATGLDKLRVFLGDQSWLVKAMATRYLGDFGTPSDYDLLVSQISNDVALNYDFNVAEDCVSALKLWPKKKKAEADKLAANDTPTEAPAPAPRGNIPDSLDTSFSIEPLTVTAPRTQIPENAPIDPQIDVQLMRLLQQRMGARPNQTLAQDPNILTLSRLSTLTGYNLKTRYSQLSFLLTEGLAGSTDYAIDQQLMQTAQQSKDDQGRAAAMVALAYTHDLQYVPIFQNALLSTSITIRFGALEALLVEGDSSIELQIGNVGRTDASPATQIYAAAAMWRMGDIFGREILLKYYQNQDWFVRAMSTHYIGELGGAEEYQELMLQMTRETNPSVQAELVSSLLKLERHKDDDN